jgi:hypothetical protein
VPFALFFLSDVFTAGLSGGGGMLVTLGSFGLIFAGVLVAGFKFLIPGFTAYTNYKARFKHDVVAEIFKIVSPSAAYSPMQGVARADFDEPGLFNTRGGFTSDDLVRGTIGQTPFEAAEVRRSYTTGGKNSTTIVVFHGLFFHLDFNKQLRGVTIVEPEDASPSQRGDRRGLVKVALENPDFERAFAVRASDEVEARYILTPAMMEQILALRARAGKLLFLAFKNHRAYIGVHYGRALFEPGIAFTTSLESIQEMAAHFELAEGVIHELDLNTRIWTKGVDDSLLKRADDQPASSLEHAMATGTLTEANLWKLATASIDGMNDDDGGPVVARPAAPWAQVESSPTGLVVHYPFGIGFLIALLLSVGSATLGLAALRALAATTGLGSLGALLQDIPVMPVAADLVAAHPVPWLAGCVVLGGFTTLGWTARVRRVEIAPDAVRVWRGFRPFPRAYPRPPYDRVIRVERAVHVGKSEGLTLVNPTASPMLSLEEARWVAAEMRRAMRASPHPSASSMNT